MGLKLGLNLALQLKKFKPIKFQLISELKSREVGLFSWHWQLAQLSPFTQNPLEVLVKAPSHCQTPERGGGRPMALCIFPCSLCCLSSGIESLVSRYTHCVSLLCRGSTKLNLLFIFRLVPLQESCYSTLLTTISRRRARL